MNFTPVIPWWILAVLGVVVIVVTIIAMRGQSRAVARMALLRGVAVLLILGACLRPGLPSGEVETATVEVNVLLVVDSSLSMVAEDHGDGTRLEGVLDDVEAITEHYAGARFALLTFDSVGRVRMPLTLDADAVRAGADVIIPGPSMTSRGSSTTSAGPVLREQLERARERYPDRPNVVYYFGDGEDTSADAAKTLGLDAALVAGGAVLGYGTEAGGQMKDIGAEGEVVTDMEGDPAVSRLDEERLRELAGELAVPYVHREAGTAPGALFSDAVAGDLEAGEDPTAGRVELTWIVALLAFLVAVLEPVRRILSVRELSAARPTTRAARSSADEAAR